MLPGDIQKGNGEKMVWGLEDMGPKDCEQKNPMLFRGKAKSNERKLGTESRDLEQCIGHSGLYFGFGSVEVESQKPETGTHSSRNSPPIFTFLKEMVGCFNFRDADLEPHYLHLLPSTGAYCS